MSSSDNKSECKKLLLRIHAANLPRVGLLKALPDTFSTVLAVEGNVIKPNEAVQTIGLGQTEIIYKHSHPQWTETFPIDYYDGDELHLHIQVFRVGKTEGDYISLGSVSAKVEEIYDSRSNTKVKRLPNGGAIFARLEELPKDCTTNKIRLQLAAQNLHPRLAASLFSSAPDTFLQISKRHPNATRQSWITVHRSNVVAASLDPSYELFECLLESLCGGDLDRPLRFAIVIMKKNALDITLGECETTLRDILRQAHQNDGGFPIQKSMTNGKEVGTLKVLLADLADIDGAASIVGANLNDGVPLPPPMLAPVNSQDLSSLVPMMPPTTNTMTASTSPPIKPPPPPPQPSYALRDLSVDWCWRETPVRLKLHSPHMIFDPNECWIKYDSASSNKLETAFQTQAGSGTCQPLPGYTVNFEAMKQTNQSTNYQRDIRRVIRSNSSMMDDLSGSFSSSMTVTTNDDEAGDSSSSLSSQETKHGTTVKWCWKETTVRMKNHPPHSVYGDPADCWIIYDTATCQTLESKFQQQSKTGRCTLNDRYTVDFTTMKQTNVSTGYGREVLRIVNANVAPAPAKKKKKKIKKKNLFSWKKNKPFKSATPVWCWRETSGRIPMHKSSTIRGDPSKGWIAYDTTANQFLESAFQTDSKSTCSPIKGYTVNFGTMKQTKSSTGYERDVQRFII